jgi:hypothetical protein
MKRFMVFATRRSTDDLFLHNLNRLAIFPDDILSAFHLQCTFSPKFSTF